MEPGGYSWDPLPPLSTLGVCAAEGFRNEPPKIDLSESLRSDFFDGAKGSETPENATFGGADALPRRLLGEDAAHRGRWFTVGSDVCCGHLEEGRRTGYAPPAPIWLPHLSRHPADPHHTQFL